MGAGGFLNGVRYALPGSLIGGVSGASTADDGHKLSGVALGALAGGAAGMAGGRLAHGKGFAEDKLARRLMKAMSWTASGAAGGLANYDQAEDGNDLIKKMLHGALIGAGARGGRELGKGVGAVVGGPTGGALTSQLVQALAIPAAMKAGDKLGGSLNVNDPEDKRTINRVMRRLGDPKYKGDPAAEINEGLSERKRALLAALTLGTRDDSGYSLTRSVG